MIYHDAYETLIARDPDELRTVEMTPLQRDRLERHLAARLDGDEIAARAAGAAWLAGSK